MHANMPPFKWISVVLCHSTSLSLYENNFYFYECRSNVRLRYLSLWYAYAGAMVMPEGVVIHSFFHSIAPFLCCFLSGKAL